MEQRNVELVRAAFDAWNKGDLDEIMPFVAEGIEWLEVGGRPETAPGAAMRGRGVVRSQLEALFETWERYRLEPEEVRAVGPDRVLAVLLEVARGRASGAEVESRWGYVMTIRGGKIARVEAYRDPEQAREAAGLGLG